MKGRRPSYVSIRARQRNIIEGIATKRITYKQASKELGVTQGELQKFLGTKAPVLRKSYNRSPSLRKLYTEGERKETRKQLGLKQIYHYRPIDKKTPIETIRRPNPLVITRQIDLLYKENHVDAQAWASYAASHGIPTSIKATRVLWRNDRISDSQFRAILKAWREHYPEMTDSYYAAFAAELEGYEEYEEAS